MAVEVRPLASGNQLLVWSADFGSAITLKPPGGPRAETANLFRASWHTNLPTEEVVNEIRWSCVRLSEEFFDPDNRQGTLMFRRAERFEKLGEVKPVQLYLRDLGQQGTDLVSLIEPSVLDRRFPSWKENLEWLIAYGGYCHYAFHAQSPNHPQALLEIRSNTNIGYEVANLYQRTAKMALDNKEILELAGVLDEKLSEI